MVGGTREDVDVPLHEHEHGVLGCDGMRVFECRDDLRELM
jgi:hypothetical protein